MDSENRIRSVKFDFKMSENEYVKLKKTAFLLNMTMADVIRDALNTKYSEMLKYEMGRKSNA